MSVIETLIDMYTAVGDQESVKKINEELETLERECTSAQNRAQEYLDSRAHEESSGLSSCSSGKSTRRSMSKAKEDQIEQWSLESAERRKHLEDLRVIQEKEEEILREIEMEQQELRHREMKINLSINQQQQKEDVKTKRGASASVGLKNKN